MARSLILCTLLFALGATKALGQVPAGENSFPTIAIQDVLLFANAPFNPFGQDVLLDDLSGVADWGFNRQAQIGDTIDFTVLGVAYEGALPGLGGYVFGAATGLDPSIYTGQIVDIVNDPNDPADIASGHMVLGGPGIVFGFEFTTGPFTGIKLRTLTSQSFGFEGFLDGLSPSPGTLFTPLPGTDEVLDIEIFENPYDPGTVGQIVGQSSQRRILVTPEPAGLSLAFVAVGLMNLRTYRGRLRR